MNRWTMVIANRRAVVIRNEVGILDEVMRTAREVYGDVEWGLVTDTFANGISRDKRNGPTEIVIIQQEDDNESEKA